MDLRAVPGIGPAYSQRLQGAGIRDAEALASFGGDFIDLSARSGIPASRLAVLRDRAREELALPRRALASMPAPPPREEGDFPLLVTPAHVLEARLVPVIDGVRVAALGLAQKVLALMPRRGRALRTG